MSKERLEELTGVKENLISINPPSLDLSKEKLVVVEGLEEIKKPLKKFLPLTIFRIMFGENQPLSFWKIQQEQLIGKSNTRP